MATVADNKPAELSRLRIAPEQRIPRRGRRLWIVVSVLVVVGLVAVFALGRAGRAPRAAPGEPGQSAPPAGPPVPPKAGDVVLTVSGYIIPRERIEISPKFLGTVRSISVHKGDAVKRGEIIVELEDDEYRARVLEAEGRLALAQANHHNAEINLRRALDLAAKNVESQQVTDEARRARDAAAAEIRMAEGQLALARTYLGWCTIRAPIDGVVLEKLVEPNELVTPQSFGGDRGPSTAVIAMADLNDLQIEIDLNEADVNKIHLKQPCRISPEAYPDKVYQGQVVEVAPQANRQKGTLQVKVQVTKPDRYLTPELTAKVDFLAE